MMYVRAGWHDVPRIALGLVWAGGRALGPQGFGLAGGDSLPVSF